jgi:hypothetical protein
MKRYGHLRQEHSLAMNQRVSFDKPATVIPMANAAEPNARTQRHPQRLMNDAPLPPSKRYMGILGGPQKIR